METLLKNNLTQLFNKGIEIPSAKWQSIEINPENPIISVFNINGSIFIGSVIKDIEERLEPDMPWSEDHFNERICGIPINPGEQYKNWPYYKKDKDDERFRSSGKFSHNYMERIWCKGYTGIRFEYGDLNDIIGRLKNDIYTRQAYLSIWHPEDQSLSNERIPCSLGYFFYYNNGALNCHYTLRSCDAIRHFKNDLYMAGRLLQFISEKLGIKAGELSYWIGSLHCFKSDFYTLKKLIR